MDHSILLITIMTCGNYIFILVLNNAFIYSLGFKV
jgi:hypothetical protein